MVHAKYILHTCKEKGEIVQTISDCSNVNGYEKNRLWLQFIFRSTICDKKRIANIFVVSLIIYLKTKLYFNWEQGGQWKLVDL